MAEQPATTRRPVDITIETEKNLKEKKYYPVRKRSYHANFSVKPLAVKFYAKSEQPDLTEGFLGIEEAICRKYISKPKDRVTEPETENQMQGGVVLREITFMLEIDLLYKTVPKWKQKVKFAIFIIGKNCPPNNRFMSKNYNRHIYGWCLKSSVQLDRSDRRFYRPKHYSWITKIGSLIDEEEKKFPKKPFTGIPFKL